MSRNIIAAYTCLTVLLLCAIAFQAGAQQYHQAPLGVYAHVDLDNAIKAYKKYKRSKEFNGEDERTFLLNLYQGILANNPGVAGITFGIHWDRVQINDPDCATNPNCPPGTDANGNDWTYLDDVFTQTKAAGKQVQSILTPGVDSPSWLFDRLRPSCDSLFGNADTGPVPNCGKVTFSKFPEAFRADGHIFPLPWNTTYQYWWQQFLSEVNDRYKNHQEFAAIAIAGPNGASTEMILPTDTNGSRQGPGWKADAAWSVLIGNSFPLSTNEYQHSDDVFVTQWETTIDTYEGIFKNVTLFLSPDSGDDFPEFNEKSITDPDWLFTADCSNATDYPMSCKAKTDVLIYFLSTEAGRQLATQVGGMTASSARTPDDGDAGIGVGGVKVLTGPLSQSSPILGGAEFDFSVTTDDLETREEQGCTHEERAANECTGISPELAAYNTLRLFFYGTQFGQAYGWPGNTPPTGPMQWVEIDLSDIVWAQTNGATPNNGTPCNQSLQDLINGASWNLFTMAGQTPPVAPPSCN